MSAKGCCYDNACAESFFHSLKVECIHGEHFASREIMRSTVFNYIECDYNRWRRHGTCGGLSPEQFENQKFVPCGVLLRLFPHGAHHTRSLRMQPKGVWDHRLIGEPEGPAFITNTAW